MTQLKAISPVIAGVVLLAVALISGLLVSTFSSTLVSKQAEKSPMCTLTTYYSIESAKYDLATGIIRAKITNRGKDDIYNFTIEADNGTVTTITPISPSETYKLKQGRSIYLKGYQPNLGNLNNIRVIPNSCPQKIAQLKVNNIDLTGNLVLNLHMDEGSGNYANDSSQYGNNGTGTTPTWTTGKYDSALQFYGDGGYVDSGNDSSLNIIDAITMEAWIKVDNFMDSYTGVITKEGSYYIFLHITNRWVITGIKNDTGGGMEVTGTIQLNTGTWYHLTSVYDSSAGFRRYVNGQRDGVTYGDESPVGSINLTTNNVLFGVREGMVQYFNGTIDEVRIYNRALTADEIIELAS